MDDEYFHMVLTFEENAGNHPAANVTWSKTLRALCNPSQVGFAKGFMSACFELDQRTKIGLFRRRRAGYTVDGTRLERFLLRVIKGLWFHELRTTPPLAPVFAAFGESVLRKLPLALRIRMENVIERVQAAPLKTVGNGTFGYRYFRIEGERCSSVWWLEFYEAVRFLGLFAAA